VDLLIVRGRMREIVALRTQRQLLLLTDVELDDAMFEDESNVLVEVQLLPRSDLLGANLREIGFRGRFGCFVLALNRVGQQLAHHRLNRIRLQAWDTLLVFGPRRRVEALAGSRDFNLLHELSMRLRLARRWWVAGSLVSLGEGFGPWAVLSIVILVTSLLTEMITNASAAVLMVPLCVSIAASLGLAPKPFLMAVAFGASMSFATPTGYQTNTMVYGPGGYRFVDYVRAGLPLNLLFWLIASLLVPVFWPY
jgi:di/tricarboxylate transporter